MNSPALWNAVWRGALAELRHRHAGSRLGPLWNLLHPLAQIATFTLVFGFLLRVSDRSGFAYALELCAGIVPWIAFAEIVQRGTVSFVANATYLKKLAVAEVVYLAQEALATTLNLLLAIVLVFALLAFEPLGVAPAQLLALPALLLFAAFGLGLGLLLATVHVFFRDTAQVVGVLLPLWMWLTPIVYPEEVMPPALRPWLLLNPAHAYVSSIRDALVKREAPAALDWLAMIGFAIATLRLGHTALSRLRGQLRDEL
jgi:lipopolysaccharide transport system permease protein